MYLNVSKTGRVKFSQNWWLPNALCKILKGPNEQVWEPSKQEKLEVLRKEWVPRQGSFRVVCVNFPGKTQTDVCLPRRTKELLLQSGWWTSMFKLATYRGMGTGFCSVEEFPPQMIADPLCIFVAAKKRLHQPGDRPLPIVDCEWAQSCVCFLEVITAARISRQQQLFKK